MEKNKEMENEKKEVNESLKEKEKAQCPHCKEEYVKTYLGRHLKACKKNPNKESKETPKKIGTPLILQNKTVCPHCKEYVSKSNIKRHERHCKDNPNHEVKERKEPLDYEQLNKNIKKCKYCGQLFHPSGLPKHESFCSENPNAKSSYKNEKSWKCEFCSAIFFNQKVKLLHVERCLLNPNFAEENAIGVFENKLANIQIDNPFLVLKEVKERFPKLFNILTPEQIKGFLIGEF